MVGDGEDRGLHHRHRRERAGREDVVEEVAPRPDEAAAAETEGAGVDEAAQDAAPTSTGSSAARVDDDRVDDRAAGTVQAPNER